MIQKIKNRWNNFKTNPNSFKYVTYGSYAVWFLVLTWLVTRD